MDKTKEKDYESPVVKVFEVTVEKGYAGSTSTVEGWNNGGTYEDDIFM